MLRARDTNARLVVRTAIFYLGRTWAVSNCQSSIVCSNCSKRTEVIEAEYAACGMRGSHRHKTAPAPCVVHCATMRIKKEEAEVGGTEEGGRALRTGEGKSEGGRKRIEQKAPPPIRHPPFFPSSLSFSLAVVIRQAIDAPQVGVMPYFLPLSLISSSRLNHTPKQDRY